MSRINYPHSYHSHYNGYQNVKFILILNRATYAKRDEIIYSNRNHQLAETTYYKKCHKTHMNICDIISRGMRFLRQRNKAPQPHHNPINISHITNFLPPLFLLRLPHSHSSMLHCVIICRIHILVRKAHLHRISLPPELPRVHLPRHLIRLVLVNWRKRYRRLPRLQLCPSGFNKHTRFVN